MCCIKPAAKAPSTQASVLAENAFQDVQSFTKAFQMLTNQDHRLCFPGFKRSQDKLTVYMPRTIKLD